MAARQSGASQALAAARAGMSERSGRSIESNPSWCPAGQRGKRTYRTRADRFEAVWSSELEPMLRESPQLQGQTLLMYLQSQYPDTFPDSSLRTLQRRIRAWRAQHGPGTERRFPQDPQPGEQMQVDFTVVPDDLVTIAGVPFSHRLAHARLRWSGFSHVEVVTGGESMEALQRVVVHAVEAFGGSPQTIRTDSLSAAYRNLQQADRDDVTADYHALCEQYGMEPTRNNRGESHENGSIESSHGHLKNDLEQQLLLRGSADFPDLCSYQQFVAEVLALRNKRQAHQLKQERPHLQPLPQHAREAYIVRTVKVSRFGNVSCDRVNYIVPRRLIGYTLTIHLYAQIVIFFSGSVEVYRMPRHHPQPGNRREWTVNFRDVIGDLIKKPGAFRDLRYRDALHPCAIWRQTWEALDRHGSRTSAVTQYLGLLALAAQQDDQHLSAMTQWLKSHLQNPEYLRAEQCRAALNLSQSTTKSSTVPPIAVKTADPEIYNDLLHDHSSPEEVA